MDEKKHKQAHSNSINTYRSTEVLTANRETILLMMYAGALRFIKKAKEATEKKDVEQRSNYIRKVQDIVTELRSNLNFKVGGDLAKNLDSLYEYVMHRLVLAHVESEVIHLDEAQKVLETLNSAWEDAISSLKKEKINPDRKGV